MELESEPIVIDIGSGTLKAGFASDDAPKCIMPMIIGKPRDPGVLVGMDQKDFYVGHEAKAKKNLLIIEEPVVAGMVMKIESIEKIFEHLMNVSHFIILNFIIKFKLEWNPNTNRFSYKCYFNKY